MAHMTAAELDRLAQDTGCDLHDDCLTCPLKRCKYDQFRFNEKRQARDDRILRYYMDGKSVSELADLFGLSVRTIQRVLARGGSYA